MKVFGQTSAIIRHARVSALRRSDRVQAHQIRATTKVGGKDFAVIPPPVFVEVLDVKKEPPKKKDKK